MSVLRVVWAAAAIELERLNRDRLFVGLIVLAAISYLLLVSLFGLTGSNAPLAIIDEDKSPTAARLVDALAGVPHAFSLRAMDAAQAQAALRSGRLVGALTIPHGFESEVRAGNTVALDVQVDNVNVDLIFDLQRALPTAILGFGHSMGFPGLRARLIEHDLLKQDVPFLSYVAVSGLALAAFMIAGALGAMAVTREWESGTLKTIRFSPAQMSTVLAGKCLATWLVSSFAMGIVMAIVCLGYGVTPPSLAPAIGSLLLCVTLFTVIGALLGTILRRTFAIMPLLFGLAMPLYIDCGSLEPARFDGESIWAIAHLSPLYYAVGLLQWTFHGVRITPEPVLGNVGVLGILILFCFMGASALLSRKTVTRSVIRP